MSKVFRAKRNEVQITYEFIDGTSSDLSVISLSTNEEKDMAVIINDGTSTMADFFEKIVSIHLQKNDTKVVKKIINEQMNEGNIVEFGKALAESITDEKSEKGND